MEDGAWCILEDFNTVCRSGERRGVHDEVKSSQRDKIILFNTLREVELEDLNLLGRCFTWYHPNGRAMSRIDRVLISEE